jgi:hypothetical protein
VGDGWLNFLALGLSVVQDGLRVRGCYCGVTGLKNRMGHASARLYCAVFFCFCFSIAV